MIITAVHCAGEIIGNVVYECAVGDQVIIAAVQVIVVTSDGAALIGYVVIELTINKRAVFELVVIDRPAVLAITGFIICKDAVSEDEAARALGVHRAAVLQGPEGIFNLNALNVYRFVGVHGYRKCPMRIAQRIIAIDDAILRSVRALDRDRLAGNRQITITDSGVCVIRVADNPDCVAVESGCDARSDGLKWICLGSQKWWIVIMAIDLPFRGLHTCSQTEYQTQTCNNPSNPGCR